MVITFVAPGAGSRKEAGEEPSGVRPLIKVSPDVTPCGEKSALQKRVDTSTTISQEHNRNLQTTPQTVTRSAPV